MVRTLFILSGVVLAVGAVTTASLYTWCPPALPPISWPATPPSLQAKSVEEHTADVSLPSDATWREKTTYAWKKSWHWTKESSIEAYDWTADKAVDATDWTLEKSSEAWNWSKEKTADITLEIEPYNPLASEKTIMTRWLDQANHYCTAP